MGEVINLRRARKSRDRAASRADADANRRLHGRSKTEKEATRAEREQVERNLDGARRDPG